jgi:hypothetical protein
MELTRSKDIPTKICLICSFVSSDITHASQRVHRFISRDHIKYVAKEAYRMPDSQHCKKALNMVIECSPDHLVNHCLRSYAFGVSMAHKVKQPFDKEVLFLGSIMHDLGLTSKFDSGNSFEIDGAKAARSFCIKHDLSPEKADLVHEMVVHHNSVGIAHKLDPEIALLHFGAGADVAGLWIDDVHNKTLSEILADYPRLDFKESMIKLLSDQAERKSQNYMNPLIELGFLKKIENVPF